MNEKRFELDCVGIFDNKTNHFYYKIFDNEEIVDLLNSLSKENEQLRKELDCIKKTNKLYGYNVECDYEWYEERDNSE